MIWLIDVPKRPAVISEEERRVRAQAALFTCSTVRLRRVELALWGRRRRR